MPEQQPKTQPRRSKATNVTLDEVALEIFAKLYLDTSGRTARHLAEKSFEAAKSFLEVAKEQK